MRRVLLAADEPKKQARVRLNTEPERKITRVRLAPQEPERYDGVNRFEEDMLNRMAASRQKLRFKYTKKNAATTAIDLFIVTESREGEGWAGVAIQAALTIHELLQEIERMRTNGNEPADVGAGRGNGGRVRLLRDAPDAR